MSILDLTIVNVALETLAHAFHATLAQIQWVVTGYMLALAAVIPISGWAVRRVGAKRIYIISLVLFTIGSAACGLSQTTTQLIIFRVLQGIGGGMILPVGQMMMAEAAGPQADGPRDEPRRRPGDARADLRPDARRHDHRERIVAVDLRGERPDRRDRRDRRHPDPARAASGPRRTSSTRSASRSWRAASCCSPTVSPRSANSAPSPRPRCSFPGSLGIALLAAFVLHALRIPKPLLDLHLYKRNTFSSASFAMFCLGAALFGSMILLPLYWQGVRGFSVVDTGLLTAPQGVGAAIAMPIAGKFADRFGGGPIALFGVCLTTIATIPFALIGAETSVLWLCVAMVVRGMGIGLAFMPAMTAAFAALERSEISHATPQLNVLQRVGGSIGVAILAVVLQRALVGATTSAEQASAFGTAFWFSAGMTAIAIVPCIILMRAERTARALKRAQHISEPDAGVLAEAVAEAVA